MTTKLNNEPVCPGDSVFDLVYGPGIVQAIECDRLIVSFGGKGRARKYSQNGMTGKHCYRTLFHRPPAIIEFPKDECRAAKLSSALKEVMKIFNYLTDQPCVVVQECYPCENEEPCAKWQSTPEQKSANY